MFFLLQHPASVSRSNEVAEAVDVFVKVEENEDSPKKDMTQLNAVASSSHYSPISSSNSSFGDGANETSDANFMLDENLKVLDEAADHYEGPVSPTAVAEFSDNFSTVETLETENRINGNALVLAEDLADSQRICDEFGAEEDSKNIVGRDLETPVNNGEEEEEDDALPPISSGDEFDENDIDTMLEKPMKDFEAETKKWAGLKQPPEIREKIVLKRKGHEFFEVLPDGWVEITHRSGIPVYLHKRSRVCTFGRPYFIGPGSARYHDVPYSSIPCLYQKKLKEWEEEKAAAEIAAENSAGISAETSGEAEANKSEEPPEKRRKIESPGNGQCPKMLPKAQVQTVADAKKRQLRPTQLHEYAAKAFEFDTVKVWRFRNWSDHRQFHRKQKMQRSTKRPALPPNVKLITIPVTDKDKPRRRPFYLNPHGKTSVSLLHEYIQRVMKSTPDYEFKTTNNPAQPYTATVIVQGNKYATGNKLISSSQIYFKLEQGGFLRG